jgi:hypothetical protein
LQLKVPRRDLIWPLIDEKWGADDVGVKSRNTGRPATFVGTVGYSAGDHLVVHFFIAGFKLPRSAFHHFQLIIGRGLARLATTSVLLDREAGLASCVP